MSLKCEINIITTALSLSLMIYSCGPLQTTTSTDIKQRPIKFGQNQDLKSSNEAPAPSTEVFQSVNQETTILVGKILLPPNTHLPPETELPTGEISNNGEVLVLTFSTLAREKEKVLMGKGFQVEAYDHEGKLFGRVTSDHEGAYMIPGAPVSQRVRIKSIFIANPKLQLEAIIDVPKEKSGRKTNQNVTTKTTAIAKILKEIDKNKLFSLTPKELDTSPEFTEFVKEIDNKIKDIIQNDLKEEFDKTEEIKTIVTDIASKIKQLKMSPTPIPMASLSPLSTPTPSPTPTASSSPSSTPTPSPTPTASSSPSSTPTPSPTPTASSSPSPSPSPSPIFDVSTLANTPNKGIVSDSSGNIFVSTGVGEYSIVKIFPDSTVTTFAGNGLAGNTDGQGTQAQFNNPWGLAIDNFDNIFVADRDNHKIRKITPSGTVTTFAGNGNAGLKNGDASQAEFFWPIGIAVDASGNIFVAEQANNTIRKITPEGNVSTYASGLTDPRGIALDSIGNIYVMEQTGHRLKKIDTNNSVSIIAGSGSKGNLDGNGTSASFYAPYDIALDSSEENIYVADARDGDGGGNRIRKVTISGEVTTIAGTGLTGFQDGLGSEAQFNNPLGIDIYNGIIYVADSSNSKIRKITIN